MVIFFFFFNDTATTEIYTLSLHDALPICKKVIDGRSFRDDQCHDGRCAQGVARPQARFWRGRAAASLDEGTGRFRLQRRSQSREDATRRTRKGPTRLWLPDGGIWRKSR